MLSASSRGLAAERLAEGGQLGVDAPMAASTAVGALRGVDEVDERAGALEVAEELDAEADAAVRPLDEPGDVGDDQGHAGGGLGDAEVGVEGGERVGRRSWDGRR